LIIFGSSSFLERLLAFGSCALSPKTEALRVQQHGPAMPVIERVFRPMRRTIALLASAGAAAGRFIHAKHAIMRARAKIGVLIYATTPMM
jgi:hypothetical protein